MAETPGVLSWVSPDKPQHWESSGGSVEFLAALVMPKGQPEDLQQLLRKSKALPLAVYFPGLGEKPAGILRMSTEWAEVAPEPFVLAAPCIPKKSWWFINNSMPYGWMEGDFQRPLAKRYCRWLEELAGRKGIDGKRVGIFGFSAGAYATAEVLAQGCGVALSGIGLGGVHGHGQWDLSDLPAEVTQGAQRKFEGFLERLREHQGAPWIEAIHGVTDKESRWEDASRIIQAIDTRQGQLGLPRVSVRKLKPEEQDQKPNRKRNRTHHNYFRAAFLRKDFLAGLLAGEAQEPWAANGWREENSRAEPSVRVELRKGLVLIPRAEVRSQGQGRSCSRDGRPLRTRGSSRRRRGADRDAASDDGAVPAVRSERESRKRRPLRQDLNKGARSARRG